MCSMVQNRRNRKRLRLRAKINMFRGMMKILENGPQLNSTKELKFRLPVDASSTIHCWEQVSITGAVSNEICSNKEGWVRLQVSDTPVLLIPKVVSKINLKKGLTFDENGVFTIVAATGLFLI